MTAIDSVGVAPAAAGFAERREQTPRSRSWLVRRALVCADLVGLFGAYVLADWLSRDDGRTLFGSPSVGILLFAAALPAWVVLAKLHRLYDRDEARPEHSTVDDFFGVLQLVTVGAWLLLVVSWAFTSQSDLRCLVLFWIAALVFVTAGRALARALCRRSPRFHQNTLIVGAGATGQLVARKLAHHPEYGLDVIGFIDDRPRDLRDDIGHLHVLGALTDLPGLVAARGVERVIVAFSNTREEVTVDTIRSIGSELDVQVDVVPRLYELVGPRVDVHTVEGMPLVGLPPTRLAPSSRVLKRSIDLLAATAALVVTAPLLAYIALRIKLDSPGPVLFRQERLGLNMKPFAALKFRTMKVGTTDVDHRAYISQVMTAESTAGANGIYKLDRRDAVTSVGRWLRRTSLDELPQLINVVRGEMSLVGPRPCLRYETDFFKPHHFERFHVPAGITGLWQVTARGHSTFGEALDMDVAYVRGWSLGLDLRLLFRTPTCLLRQKRATA